MAIQNILIIRTGALGDVILTLPAIHNLRLAHPEAQIHLLGNPRLLALAQGPNVHIHDIDRAQWASLFSPNAALSEPLAGFLARIDLAVSYLPDPDGALTRHLHGAGIPSVLTCAPRPPQNPPVHAVDHLLAPVKTLGVPIRQTVPRIALTPNDFAGLDPLRPEGVSLLIHPGSGGQAKCWPVEHFAQTAARLADATGCQMLISAGPADGDLAHRLAQKVAHARLLPQMALRRLAALMTTCTAYLGNDSGPSHLAAAVGLPTVVLFGPTDPAHWIPRGETVCAIRASDKNMASLSPDRVLPRLLAILKP